MAMSVGGDTTDKPMSDINTTPLVDVMLVLLIVFMIAVPVVLQTVPLKLPNVKYQPTTDKPEDVNISIKGGGSDNCVVYWNLSPVGHDELLSRAVDKLKTEVARLGSNITPDDLPEVHVRADVDTPYKCVGGVVYTMQSAGYSRVGFISQPNQ